MKRHPGLQRLSREHHQALVLVRLLRTTGHSDALLSRARAGWRADVAPHFAVEERELLPLCHGAGEPLEGQAETIRQDHAAIRALFEGLSSGSWPGDAAALADRLESHVRFEERVWFPALETALDEATLASLEWRLDPEPQVPIPAPPDCTSDLIKEERHLSAKPGFRQHDLSFGGLTVRLMAKLNVEETR